MKLREFIGRLSFEEKKKEREKKGIENVYKHKIRQHKKKTTQLGTRTGRLSPCDAFGPYAWLKSKRGQQRGGSPYLEAELCAATCNRRVLVVVEEGGGL